MFYIVSIILSLICFMFSVFAAATLNRTYKRTRILTPSRVLAIGVFLSTLFLLFPYYYREIFAELSFIPRLWESIWVSAHHVIRFFVADVDFVDIQRISGITGFDIYYILGTILLVSAPLLTFNVVISFFRNVSAYRKYISCYFSPAYVFSELNEKSLALAKDLKKNHPSAIIAFTDVFDENNEESHEIVERAKEIGAICFKKDMLSINFSLHSKRSTLCFFAMAEERSVRGMHRQVTTATTPEEENLKQAYHIANNPIYANHPNTQLFVFSSSTQGEIFIDNLPRNMIDIRRVDDFRPLVLRTLHTCGKEILFDTAIETEGGEKEINVIVVGAGGYGSEMIKNLAWYCQMDGYRLSIDVFDGDPLAREKFAFTCPALMNEKNNGDFKTKGIPHYSINFHCGLQVNTSAFTDALTKVKLPTYVFVSLGSDALNVNTAIVIRRIFKQIDYTRDPFIHAVVYDSENKKGLENATNNKGQPYNITYIGDLEQSYSEDVIINEDLEKEALSTYMHYVTLSMIHTLPPMRENDRHASMLYALSRELCVKMGKIYSPKVADCTEDEYLEYACLDHANWMARMYSLGYVYSSTRSDLAKTHHLLVPFDELPSDIKKHYFE